MIRDEKVLHGRTFLETSGFTRAESDSVDGVLELLHFQSLQQQN